MSIRSDIAALTRGLRQLYADFPVLDRRDTYVDFEAKSARRPGYDAFCARR